MFYVAVIGLKNLDNYKLFSDKCTFFMKNKASEGITICTPCKHDFIDRFSKAHRISVMTFYADWGTYGKEAAKQRSFDMLKTCNGVISFEDGTRDTDVIKQLAAQMGIPVKKVKPTT